MMEDLGVENREQRFGRIVVQTEIGEVLSLDLFETPDLVCRGYYLPPSTYALERMRELPESPWPPTPEVELRVTRGAIEELERTSDFRTRREQDRLFFEVYGERFETYGVLDLVSERSEAGPEVWTGSLDEGRMAFVLERYGSPEVYVLIPLIYLLIYMDRRATELDDECWRRAVEMCGQRRIKRYKVRRTLMGLADPQGFSHDCEIECM